jgi:hypothetical protein
MICKPVKTLIPGDCLALALPDPGVPEQDLLATGTELTSESIDCINESGINYVWVENSSIELNFPAGYIDLQNALRTCLSVCKHSFAKAATERSPLLPAPFLPGLKHLLQTLPKIPPSWLNFSKLGFAPNSVPAHCVEVCLYSLALAMRLQDYIKKERSQLSPEHAIDLQNLGLGALVHDIGLVFFPKHLQFQSGKNLSAEDATTFRKHPGIGFQLVRNTFEASAANIVLNHHQRWDGHGYPDRTSSDTAGNLNEHSIPIFSRITSLADTLATTMLLPTIAGQRKQPVQALFEMRFSVYRNWFDPSVERIFFTQAQAFSPGSEVVLNDGTHAVVITPHTTAPCHPVVQPLNDKTDNHIDLANQSSLYIAKVEGQDVTAFLF